MHSCSLRLGCNKRRAPWPSSWHLFIQGHFMRHIYVGGLWAWIQTAQCSALLLLQPCVNEANMQTLVWTLVGSLCSSSASLVCCPGQNLPGSRHPHLPESKQIKQLTRSFFQSQHVGKQTWERMLCSLQSLLCWGWWKCNIRKLQHSWD